MSEDKAHSTLEHFVNGAFKFCQLIGNALSAYHKWYIKNADFVITGLIIVYSFALYTYILKFKPELYTNSGQLDTSEIFINVFSLYLE